MPELIAPVVRVHASFLAAMAEFRVQGRGNPADKTTMGREIREHGSHWSTVEGFASYVRWLGEQPLDGVSGPEGFVPPTTLWWMDGPEYLGRIGIRRLLTPSLREAGGHIGYDVRPTARRSGHATAMLQAALPVASTLGIGSVLLTCDVDNVASRKVIERNGGVFEDQRGNKLRFWIPAS